MTPQQIQTVQSTWQMVVPIADTAVELLYDRMFELDPELAKQFPADMTEHRRRVIALLGVAVTGLTRVDTIVPVLRNLGARHNGYGLRNEHYATAGAALLWALEKGLGPAFTDEARDAWAAVYALVATTMQEGAAMQQGERLAA